jgi:PAS domain S-box-containing protein
MVDGQNDFLCCLNSDCQITFANKAFANEFETTPKRMIGNAYKSYIRTPIHRTFLKVIEDLQYGSSLHEAEYEIFDENGCVIYQRWQFRKVLDEHEKVAEIQCVGRDVTQERVIQNQTEEEKEKYRHIAEITSDWMWEVDRNYFYIYTNPVVFDFLGYKPNEVLGKKPFDFMIERDARRVGSIFQYSLAKGKPLKAVENINFHKDGTRVVLETNAISIVSNDGSVIGFRGVTRNISARKREEAKRLIGLLPICASCKMIRDDKGYWNRIETYIENHSAAEFSHTICPQCTKKLYSELE